MKICPKCHKEHDKNGTFCSRTCANSHPHSDETNKKIGKSVSNYLLSTEGNAKIKKRMYLYWGKVKTGQIERKINTIKYNIQYRVSAYLNELNMSSEEFIKICNEKLTFSDVHRFCLIKVPNISRQKISIIAKYYNCYKSNPGKAGFKYSQELLLEKAKIRLDDILNNRVEAGSNGLKKLLFRLGIKNNKCEICAIEDWNNNKLVCELHHIDGNTKNNKLDNIQILCPNCHSQTPTFRFKRGKKKNLPQ